MKTLYLAKEPDAGVRNDLSHIQGEITIVDCLNAYGDYYRKKGYNCISRTEFFALKDMEFDVVIGNPPYQDGSKDGGQNKIYNQFSKRCLELVKSEGIVSLITPTSVLKGSKRFSLVGNKNLKLVDFTANDHFNVGVNICRWVVDGKHKGDVTVVTKSGTTTQSGDLPIRDLDNVDSSFVVIYDAILSHSKLIDNRMFSQNAVDAKNGRSTEQSEVFRYPVYKISGDTDILVQYNKPIPKTYGESSFVVSMSKTFDKSNTRVTILDYDVNHVSVAATPEQAENIESFLFSDYFVSLVDAWKKIDGYGFNNAVKFLPKFDKNRSWDSVSVKEFIESFV
jgi:hypothetical protein